MIQRIARKFGDMIDIQGWGPSKVLSRNALNTAFEWVDASQTSQSTLDEYDAILALLAPQKPPELSLCYLSTTGSYIAKESSTGISRANVVNSATPTINCNTPFFDGDKGILNAYTDNAISGTATLSKLDDTGTYASLKIHSDLDPYIGQFGKQGFWKQLSASIAPMAALAIKVPHTFYLEHSTTGKTPDFTVYCDNAVAPTISNIAVGGITYSSQKKISGIPCLSAGDLISVSSTANQVVGAFYNSSQIIRFSGPNISTVNFSPSTPPVSGASIASGTKTVTVSSGNSAGSVITFTAFNSTGATVSSNISTSIRISTTVSESSLRVKSGIGELPSSGYGGTYDSSELLTMNSELQMEVDGRTLYPPAVDYRGNQLAGPDYSIGLGTEDRWITINLGMFSGTSKTFTINGAVNFGTAILIPGIKIYAKVEGATGWVNVNAAYPGVGSPAADNDPALVISTSSSTIRTFTFGSIVRTGVLFLRIGLPSGSTKSFVGIS